MTPNPRRSVAELAGATLTWLRRRRDRHQILGLSDRTLDDLGLTRADVEGAFAVSFRQAVDYAELDRRRRRHLGWSAPS